MIRKRLIALASGLVMLGLGPTLAEDAPSKIVAVTIDNFTFSPPDLVVAPGTRVTWTNRDDIPHTVVDAAEPRSVKSPPLDTGEQFAHTFVQPGVFHYFCSIHPHMQGTITVR